MRLFGKRPAPVPAPVDPAVQDRAVPATDAVVAAVQAAANGAVSAAEWSSGGLQAAIAIWTRACDAIEIRGADLPSEWLSETVRTMLETGESIQVIDGVAPLTLLPVASHDITGGANPASWRYRCDLASPSGTVVRNLPREGVLHFRWAWRRAEPWKGLGPAQLAPLLGALASNSEGALRADMRAVSGALIPLPSEEEEPEEGEEGINDQLRKSLAGLNGKTAFVETTSGGWSGSGDKPQGDWIQRRIGPAPDGELIRAWQQAGIELAQVAAVPSALIANVEGSASREAWRRFIHASVQPLCRRIASELSAGLAGAEIEMDASSLAASDIQGRARAFASMVTAGMDVGQATALSGLLVPPEE